MATQHFKANLFALINFSSSDDVGFAETIIEALTAGRYRLARYLFLFAAPFNAMSDSTLPPATTMMTLPFFPAVLWVMASGMGVNRAHFRCCSSAQSTL